MTFWISITALVWCLTLGAGAPSAVAAGPDAWVPARWQGGPLELQRRARDRTLPDAPALRETIRQWYDPATLALLEGTPVNCLLVTWSAGGDPETEKQQQALVAAYARSARARGIKVLGLIHAPAIPSSAVEPAIQAGLDGLVLDGAFPQADRIASELRQALRNANRDAVVVFQGTREQLARPADILATQDAVPPGLEEWEGEAEAGPSSEPWIDSNIWLVRSLRSTAAPHPLWLMETLAADATAVDYLRAIADAAAGGGRWALALNDQLRHGLRMKEPEAIATWREIAAFLKFREERTEWFDYPPLGVFGFVRDGSGSEQDLSLENFKLAFRRRLPLRLIERSQLSASSLEGLRAVHAIDLVRPTPLERRLLTEFAQSGGVLVVGRSWQQVDTPEGQAFAILPAGSGRIVVYRDEWPEPGELAGALPDLLGRDRLVVRLFRAPSVLTHVSANNAGGQVLVHLLNYATYPAESALVRVEGDFRRARLHTPERPPEELRVERSEGRVEVTVGRLPVYGVLVFEQ